MGEVDYNLLRGIVAATGSIVTLSAAGFWIIQEVRKYREANHREDVERQIDGRSNG